MVNDQEDNEDGLEPPKKIIKLSNHSNEIPHDSVRIEIHVPSFQGIEGVRVNELHDQKKFDMPTKFLKYDASQCKYDLATEYDMQGDDETWLNKYNQQSRKPLSDLDFERIYALINREYGAKNGYVSVSGLTDLALLSDVRVPAHHIMNVRDWWRQKNQKLVSDLSTREERMVSMTETKEQMIALRNDFERLRLLVELVKKREKLKQKYALNCTQQIRILARQYSPAVNHLEEISNSPDDEELQEDEQRREKEEEEALHLRRQKKLEQERKLQESDGTSSDGYESEDLIEDIDPTRKL